MTRFYIIFLDTFIHSFSWTNTLIILDYHPIIMGLVKDEHDAGASTTHQASQRAEVKEQLESASI